MTGPETASREPSDSRRINWRFCPVLRKTSGQFGFDFIRAKWWLNHVAMRIIPLTILCSAALLVGSCSLMRERMIFVLAGQSNMSGRGDLATLPVFPHEKMVFVYRNSAKWTHGYEPVDDATNQIDLVSADFTAKAGPSMAFGDRMAQLNPGVEIGLVPCARGSSHMADWKRNLNRNTLYGSLIARAKEAADAGRLSGLIWYQGESDIDDPEAVRKWPSDFDALVSNVRSDLGIPDLPVVMTIIGPSKAEGAATAWRAFVDMQTGMALPPRVIRVSASDLAVMDGDVHLTTPSYVELGRRFATAMQQLLQRRDQVASH